MTRGVMCSEKIVNASARNPDIEGNRNDALARAERKLAKAEKTAAAAKRQIAQLRADQ